MSSPILGPTGPITRREVLRRTVIFSAAAATVGSRGILRAEPPETKFPDRGLHLLAVGDYGTKGDESQTSVAKAMAKFAKSLNQPLTAVLALGDNFYKTLTPDRFENHFEDMYSKDGLNCPFYACAGNHDYGAAKYDSQEGKLQMQLDYAKNNPSSRWKFPAKWYALRANPRWQAAREDDRARWQLLGRCAHAERKNRPASLLEIRTQEENGRALAVGCQSFPIL